MLTVHGTKSCFIRSSQRLERLIIDHNQAGLICNYRSMLINGGSFSMGMEAPRLWRLGTEGPHDLYTLHLAGSSTLAIFEIPIGF